MRITDSWLRAVKPRRDRWDVTVDGREGLVVRVHPSGTLSFRFRYQRDGERRWMVLGEFPQLSLADAHEIHAQAGRELAKGFDPIEERERRRLARERARQDRVESGTVANLIEQFVHRRLRAERWDATAAKWVRDPKMRTKARKRPDDANALLQANLVAKLGTKNARDVTRRQLIELLDGIVDRGAPVLANRVHALLRQLFDWAAAKDLIPASPMAGIERPGGDETPRARALTADEIKTLWTKIADADMAEPTRLALKLLLVTAQRRGEITFAKWSHFDLDAKLWTIPVELLKSSHARKANPEPHVVPLSPLALDVLEKLKALTGEGAFVLPARADKKRDKAYSERVLSRAVRENQKQLDIEHFTPHDLRRTAASFMTKLGVPRLHVEKVLNHSTGDIAEIYDRHNYADEKRVALDRWGEYLTNLVEGREQTVVPLARSA
jgi:integrase